MKEINVKADLWQLTPCWAVAGTRGSYGSCRLIFDLSPHWESLGKRVTFFPADGSEAVAIIMTGNSVTVPAEVMAHKGTAGYVIDGVSLSGEAIVSCRGELRIVDTAAPGGKDPIEYVPNELDQIRAELEALRAEIREMRKVR